MTIKKTKEKDNKITTAEDLMLKTAVVQDVFTKNLPKIGIAIIVILIVAGGYLGLKQFQDSKNSDAYSSLAKGQIFYEQEKYEEAIPLLEETVKDFSGKNAAGYALFYLANSNYYTGNYDEAKKNFEEYLSDYNDELLIPSVYAGVGDCLSSLGNYSEAAAQYEKAFNLTTSDATKANLLFKQGLVYEKANDREKAKECYQKVKDDFEKSTEASTIDAFIGRISQ
ncbi:tetratricopeptide repeat protein [bacterium]|nr:tetratricopeptide repeat protein [bacterium]